jgi:hypothetical protein
VLLVGPGYSPENINAWSDPSLYESYMIQYRNFGDFKSSGGGGGGGQFGSIAKSGSGVVITWTGSGSLASAPDITGPWTVVPNASSPQTVQPTGGRSFYRLQ